MIFAWSYALFSPLLWRSTAVWPLFYRIRLILFMVATNGEDRAIDSVTASKRGVGGAQWHYLPGSSIEGSRLGFVTRIWRSHLRMARSHRLTHQSTYTGLIILLTIHLVLLLHLPTSRQMLMWLFMVGYLLRKMNSEWSHHVIRICT